VLPRAYRLIRFSITLSILAVAVVAGLILWDYYTASPWTRNGQVRAQVVNIAPRVSAPIIDVRVHDNQFVHRNDVLYVIDPYDFRVQVDIETARVAERRADYAFRTSQYERRRNIPGVALSGEERQQYEAQASQAKAQLEAAEASLRQAQINLERTEVRSTLDGYVTNLLMRRGDFATAGTVNIHVIDNASWWVDGYFEETKLHHVQIGDRVRMDLMGAQQPLFGHVESITRGIASGNAAMTTQGLPDVDPVYTWVRLAQRIPVRVRIDTVPNGLVLAAGMTATVTVVSESGRREHGSLHDALARLQVAWRHALGRS